MKIIKIQTGVLGVNTYFLVNETSKTAVIIDGGQDFEKVRKTANELGVKIKAELLTHAHFDHSGNAKRLQDDGVKIYAPEKDFEKLISGETLADEFGLSFHSFTPDYKVRDGETLFLEGYKIKVLSTPGHTDGSVCYITGNSLFSGDTLFKLSIGRTDFPTGSFDDMKKSLRKLYSLEGDFTVYTGHGETTTLKYERNNNPYNSYL